MHVHCLSNYLRCICLTAWTHRSNIGHYIGHTERRRTMSTVDYVNPTSLAAPLHLDYCRRCGGLMVPEVFPELGFHWSEVAAERCVQCGEIIDSVILKNRLRCPSNVETERGVQP